MVGKKISDFESDNKITGSELIYAVDDNTDVKLSTQQIKDFAIAELALSKADKSEIVQGQYSFATLADFNAVKATIPVNSTVIIDEAGANQGTNTWNGTTLTKSAYDPLTQAKNYSDANAIFKPVLNPTEKNLNNVPYGVLYYTVSGDITIANNFPEASRPSYVLTYSVLGSSVKCQRVILPFFNPVRIFDRSFTGTWSAWSENTNKAALDALTTIVNNNLTTEQAFEAKVFSIVGKNKLDKSKIVDGEYVSPSQSKIIASSVYKRSGFIPVIEGQQYCLSGTSPGTTIGWYSVNDKTATALSVITSRTGIAPIGAKFAVVNITNDGTTTYNDTTQFEVGSSATTYEPYRAYIDLANVYGSDGFLTDAEILYYDSFNKIDPAKVNFSKRYSTGSKTFVTDSLLISASDYIPVTEGEWYTVSGTAIFGLPKLSGCQGGYFSSYGATAAVDNISFVAPVSGTGAAFKVPTGLGITHVVISLDKTAGNVLDGLAQMEVGEMPTAYQAYALKPYIKSALLPAQTGSDTSATFDDAAWFKYTKADSPTIYPDKLPNFRKHMLLKDKDVCVVMTGTSLTARTSEHSTLRADAHLRPPMMHSNAFCSHVWDALKWEGQQYRRYDASYFTETGTFATASNLAEWDDGAYRDGVTRYSGDANAAVQFTVPIDAWQFNFIYRTDSAGTTGAKVEIAEGDGKMQVYDEASSTWVEANNYIFSMLEATPVTRSVAIPNVITEVTTNYTLASKGNTTYQKRLKMRCRSTDGSIDSRASAKTVTISNNTGSGRFMYWGVEWSPRQYMVTYVNSSRGSHNTNAISTSGLPRFQDNEVWSFKPDLILSELAIHNDGAAAAGVYPVGQWKQLAKHYVTNLSYELSLYSRAAFFNQTPEYAFFMGTITWNFGGINDDGSLKYSLQTSSSFGSAKAMSALDKYQEAIQYLREQNIVCLDTAQKWVEAGNALFSDLKTATLGSGKGGATFTNEGSHWNDTGGKIMAKAVLPLIK